MNTDIVVPNEAALQKNTVTATDALTLKVTNDTDLVRADSLAGTLVSIRKEALADIDPIVESTNAAHKAACALRTKYIGPLDRAIGYLKEQASTYNRHKEFVRRAEERRLQEDAEREQRARAVQQAAEVAKTGDVHRAQSIMQEAVNTPAPTVTVAKEGPKLGSLRFTTDQWATDITDLKLYAKAVVDGVIPPIAIMGIEKDKNTGRTSCSYLIGRARSDKGTLSIPGVRVVPKDGASAR